MALRWRACGYAIVGALGLCAQAGLLRNPILTLFLPWGPKQLEATLKWPVDAIWQRPARVAAARASADTVAELVAEP